MTAGEPMGDTARTRGSTRVEARTKAALPALTAFFLSSLYIRMLNATIFPAVAALAPLAREASTGCGIATSLLVALVMLRRPSGIRGRLFAWLAPALAGGGHLVGWAGVALDSGAIATAGLCLSSVGYTWLSLLVLVALCHLDFRRLAVGLPLASGLAYLCAPVLEAIPLAGGVACLTYALATVPLINRSVRQPLELAASSPALDGATLLRPSSYLPLTNTLYVCMLLFSIASGFGTRFFSDAGSLWGQVAAGGTLLALAAWNVRARGSDRLDALFSLVLIVTMAGFFLALLPTASIAASLLLGVGSSIVGVLFDLVLVVVAARNPRAELLVFAWGGVMSTPARTWAVRSATRAPAAPCSSPPSSWRLPCSHTSSSACARSASPRRSGGCGQTRGPPPRRTRRTATRSSRPVRASRGRTTLPRASWTSLCCLPAGATPRTSRRSSPWRTTP